MYELFDNILFQLLEILHKIYQSYPNFRHNDYTDKNILIVMTDLQENMYQVGDKKFKFKEIVTLKLIDFDFAVITGVVDNIKCDFFPENL